MGGTLLPRLFAGCDQSLKTRKLELGTQSARSDRDGFYDKAV